MAIETALVEVLTGDVDIAAAVGARVYPVVLPQNPTLPAVVYQEVHVDARAAADGDTGERVSRFLVNWWAPSFAAAKAGKGLLVRRLTGYSGGIIGLIDVDGGRDDYDPETGRWRQQVELEIFWSEDIE